MASQGRRRCMPIDLPPTECLQGGQPGWSMIFGSQLHEDQRSFPEGIGFRIKPHQQFVLETHVINPRPIDMEVKSSLSMTYAAPGTVRTAPQAGQSKRTRAGAACSVLTAAG